MRLLVLALIVLAATVRAEPAVPSEVALADELSQRGLNALEARDVGALFARAGSTAVSPFSVGLTLAAADAMLSPAASNPQRYVPLTATVAACFSFTRFGHEYAFVLDVQPTKQQRDLAWALTPGQHLGQSSDPHAAESCARAYADPRSVAAPSV